MLLVKPWQREVKELCKVKHFEKLREGQAPSNPPTITHQWSKSICKKNNLKTSQFPQKAVWLVELNHIQGSNKQPCDPLKERPWKKNFCLEFVLARQINILSHNSTALLTKQVIVFPLMPSLPFFNREQVAKVLSLQRIINWLCLTED